MTWKRSHVYVCSFAVDVVVVGVVSVEGVVGVAFTSEGVVGVAFAVEDVVGVELATDGGVPVSVVVPLQPVISATRNNPSARMDKYGVGVLFICFSLG